ncbi:hypothetical protein V6N13_116623 [Hibiscus sabdariffa]
MSTDPQGKRIGTRGSIWTVVDQYHTDAEYLYWYKDRATGIDSRAYQYSITENAASSMEFYLDAFYNKFKHPKHAQKDKST